MKFGKKQLVLASLVLALGAAVYLNWQFAGTGRLPVGDSSSETSQLGAAQLVNNTYVETVNDGAESGEASGDALAQARMDRQNSRDQALELLDGVLEDVDSDSAAKQQAVEEASAIAQNILAESNVESLLEAKGYTFLEAEVRMVPQNYVTLTSEEDIKNMEKLLEFLEDNDDVQNVYHNWEQD